MPDDKHDLHRMASEACVALGKVSLHKNGMVKVLGDKLRAARLAKKLSQGEVGAHVGVSRAAIGQWESEDSQPTTANLLSVCELYGVRVEDVTDGTVRVSNSYSGEGRNRRATMPGGKDDEFMQRVGGELNAGELPRDVPVYGIAAGGSDADFYSNGEIVDYVRRPAGVAKAKNVYAIYVVGSSMEPRYAEGDLLYVNPSRSPSIGDFVIIELHPIEGERTGRGFVKRLVRRTATKIVCEQYNPSKQIEFTAKQVKNIHRIVPWSELLGM